MNLSTVEKELASGRFLGKKIVWLTNTTTSGYVAVTDDNGNSVDLFLLKGERYCGKGIASIDLSTIVDNDPKVDNALISVMVV